MECIVGAEGTGLGVVAGARRDRSMDNQQASEILERELESGTVLGVGAANRTRAGGA